MNPFFLATGPGSWATFFGEKSPCQTIQAGKIKLGFLKRFKQTISLEQCGQIKQCLLKIGGFCSLGIVFRQHDASKYSFVCQVTSKLGWRLKFGMMTVLTNIISTKVLWLVEDNHQWKMTFGGRRPLTEDDTVIIIILSLFSK